MENINELLYMIHMNDEFALKELLRVLTPGYEAEIANIVKPYPIFGNYKEEMREEMFCTVYIAIESYRYDIDCSFRTYAMLIARRRMYRLIYTMHHKFVAGFNRTGSLDLQIRNKTDVGSLFASRDMLSYPEYVLDMNEAVVRLEETVDRMPKQFRQVYDTWCAGYKYKAGSERLGITYKQYESNLRKVKRMVRQAVMA